ncbi:zinc finger protein 346-like isoform X2 [Physella acuta]|nr:zinc finger protein 346-like isoform X2 [Physella acuta]XP_059141041.1 zinc finger protein 346-like isoform X2 [Physella acuta]XP_059141042.1 zinc finger protein 346-like isoform X2 [Physella acuta]XP_059141043.1 zinc finger protein 346-like isoform X2 [Physella acuta]XP_059141044.1 zinc finger protein 346-like isoform X2 [Physella acuta]
MEETAADLAYKECLVRNIRELFISSIVPENFLYRVHKHDKNVLTSDDIARFLKKCTSGLYEKDINMELLDRLSKYDNWFECILKMLQDPELKQAHLVKGFEELKRKTDLEMGIQVARPEQEVNTNDILNRPVRRSDFELDVQSDSVSKSKVTCAIPEMLTQDDGTGMVNGVHMCMVCNIALTSAQHKEQHILGKQHLKKIMERAQSTPSVTPQKESPQVKSMDRADNSIDSTKYCYVCQLSLSSVAVSKQHYEGRSHKKRVEAQQLENGNTSNSLENSQEQTDSTEVDNSNSCSLLTDSISSMSISDAPAQGDGCGTVNGKSWCLVCNIELTSEQHKTQHVEGKAHKKKLKDSAQLEATDATAAHDESITYCSVCKISLTSRENATEHYKGKNHKKKLEAVKVNAK